jgi:hypothetical protein
MSSVIRRLSVTSRKILVLIAAFAMISAAPLLAMSVSASSDVHYRCVDHGAYCFTISPYNSASGDDFYVNAGTTLTITGTTTNSMINHASFTFLNTDTHSRVSLSGTSTGTGTWQATLSGSYVVAGETLNVKVTFTDRHHHSVVESFRVHGEVFVAPEFPVGTVAAVGAPIGALGLFAVSKRTKMVQILHK